MGPGLRRFVMALGSLAVLLLAVSPPVAAHDPIFLTEGQKTPAAGPFLPDGTISFALYGRLDAGGDTRGFQVQLAAGDRLLVELLIPDRAPENRLADAELPTATVTAPDGSSFDLTPEMREPFDEPFTGTSYVGLSRLEGAAEAGVYDVVVTGAVPARFTVAVGTTETFFTPVDRVENRVESFPAIAGPLAAWYETPPAAADAEAEAAVPVTAAPIPSTTSAAPTTEAAIPTPAQPGTAAEVGAQPAAGDASEARDGLWGTVAVAGGAGIVAAVGIALVLRRRRAR